MEFAIGKLRNVERDREYYTGLLKQTPEADKQRVDALPQSYDVQADLLRAEIDRLREWFSGRFDNVKGVDATSALKDFEPEVHVNEGTIELLLPSTSTS